MLKDTKDFIQYIEKLGTIQDKNIDNIAKSFGNVSESVIKAAHDLKNGNITLEEFKNISNQASSSAATFIASLKSIGANMAITLGINVAINFLKNLWDDLNVTVEEQQSKVEGLKLSYESLQSEYTDLSQKQDLTDAEKRRLEYLERRLELDEKILKAEQSQLFDEKTGNGFTDRFDKDNLNTQYRKETAAPKGIFDLLFGSHLNPLKNQDSYEGISELFQKRTGDIDSIHEQIAAWKELQETEMGGSALWNILQDQIDQALDKETKYIDQLSGKENQLTINLGKYADHIADMQDALDSGALTEEQKLAAQAQIDLWTDLYNRTQAMIDAIQKLNGTYEDTRSVLRQIDEKYGGGYSDHPFIAPALDAARTQEQKDFVTFSHGLSAEDQELVNSQDFADALQKVKESLNGAALSADDYAAALAAVKGASDSLSPDPNLPWDYAATLQNLATVRETLSVLDQTYAKLSNPGGQLGFEDLSSIYTAFSSVEGIDSYIQQIQEAGANTEEVTSILEALVGAYLDCSGVLPHVTEENQNLIISFLEEMGILNAEELVLAQLNQQAETLTNQKQLAADKGYDLANASLAEAAAFFGETEAVGAAGQQLAQLALEKIHLNGQSIDTAADIDNVIALANAAQASAEVIAQLTRAKNVIAAAEKTSTPSALGKDYYDALALMKQLENGTYNFHFKSINPDIFKVPKNTSAYSGGGSGGPINQAGTAVKDTSQEIVDAINAQIDALERKPGWSTVLQSIQPGKKLIALVFGKVPGMENRTY